MTRRRQTFVLAIAIATLFSHSASADFHIFSPNEIDQGELEIEHNGDAQFDRRPENSGAQSHTIEFGTGLTSWWQSEIEFGFDRDPGFNEPTLFTQIVSENTFRLTEPGEYFVDAAMYAEYGQTVTTAKHAGPNELTFGPLISKDIGRTTHTVNLFLTRELGPDQDTRGLDFSYAWQSRWNLWAPLSPAVEIYGDSGIVGHSPRLNRQELLVGPVGIGTLSFHDLGVARAGRLKYELGWLFGATQASPNGTLRWRVELEIPF